MRSSVCWKLWVRFAEGVEVLEMPEAIRCALFYMPLEAMEGRLPSLEVQEVQRCGGWVRFAGGVEVLEMPEAIRCALLCMPLEAKEGRLPSLEGQRCSDVRVASVRWRCRNDTLRVSAAREGRGRDY